MFYANLLLFNCQRNKWGNRNGSLISDKTDSFVKPRKLRTNHVNYQNGKFNL